MTHTATTLIDHLEAAGFHCGRMVSGSKIAPKGHTVFWNACIFQDGAYGDIDLTADEEKLQEIANQYGPFYVTREQPWRFQGWAATIKGADPENYRLFALRDAA